MNKGYLAVVAATAAAGLVAVGYKNSAIERPVSTACEAVDEAGHRLELQSYPVGNVAVEYQKNVLLGNHVTHTIGTISLQGTEYTLHIPGLPQNLANSYIPGFHDTAGQIVINDSELGRYALTASCRQGQGSTEVQLP